MALKILTTHYLGLSNKKDPNLLQYHNRCLKDSIGLQAINDYKSLAIRQTN